VRGEPTGFWSKLTTDGQRRVVAWHPLEDHCADVAACALALLDCTRLRTRLARLAGQPKLDARQIQRLGVFAALHDVGKYNVGFQNKSRRDGAPTRGHVREAVRLLTANGPEKSTFVETLRLTEFVPWFDGDEDALIRLFIAVLCHHGRPYPAGQGPDGLWAPDETRDPFAGMARLADLLRSWLPDAFDDGGPPLPVCPEFQHAYCGVVTLADWMGSHTGFFPFREDGDAGDRMEFARERAREVLARLGTDSRPARESLGTDRPGFDRIAAFEPRPAQAAVHALPCEDEPQIAILEAATGSGKTETALARFATLFHAGVVDGLYFALPTRTAATQLHRRVQECVARLFPDPATPPPVTLAVPGYFRVDDVCGRLLPGFEVRWDDEDSAGMSYRGWASEHPKRYLAGSIVVGTIDQVLLSTLRIRHAHMRAVSLLRHLLVVDEVHASDAYMNRLLESVLDRHTASGGHSLLMSATLGASARHRFLGTPVPDLERACEAAYPCLTICEEAGVMHTPLEAALPSKRIENTLVPLAGAPTAIAERALAAAREGARVLVIRNTVRDCVATQCALEDAGTDGDLLFTCAGRAAPHHARFAPNDRESLDAAIEAAFGSARPSGGCVAVATQTVQQSLDLDADMMLTDLCPVDVLLQRLGRLHRHPGRDRPPGFETPRVTVLVPAERDLASFIGSGGKASGRHGHGTVYEDLRIIETTWRLLQQRRAIAVPDDCRELVELATHPEALRGLEAEDPRWSAHGTGIDGAQLADKRQADLKILDWSIPFGDDECQFPSLDVSGRIASRLGESDRLVQLPDGPKGPFGARVRQLRVPAWMGRDLEGDTEAETTTVSEEGFTFVARPVRFHYDRHGLRRGKEEST